MGQNGKFSVGVFAACMVLIFVAIGLCALEKTDLASAVGIAACALCAPGMYLAFFSWSETKEQPPISKEELPAQETTAAQPEAAQEDPQ